MLTVDWDSEKGWHQPAIVPHGPLKIDPAAPVLHYAIECFEGMKAYVDKQNKVRLFRPDKNMERLNRSTTRLALPTVNGNQLLECLKKLLKVDKSWIPNERGYSLYIRPTVIGNSPSLGVGASNHALLYIILAPVGPYYPEGFKPVKLLADERYVRAWPGGTGDAKIGAYVSLPVTLCVMYSI
jgi:branched-chain amino acid aminotransferase